MVDPFQRATRDNLNRAIDVLRSTGAHAHVPLFEAVRSGSMALIYVTDRTATVSLQAVKQLSKPVLILIGDDDGKATGPAGWACAVSVTGWAKRAVVHGCGAEPDHYRAATVGAIASRRLVMVETESRYIAEWTALLEPTPTLVIAPRGGVHPLRSAEIRH